MCWSLIFLFQGPEGPLGPRGQPGEPVSTSTQHSRTDFLFYFIFKYPKLPWYFFPSNFVILRCYTLILHQKMTFDPNIADKCKSSVIGLKIICAFKYSAWLKKTNKQTKISCLLWKVKLLKWWYEGMQMSDSKQKFAFCLHPLIYSIWMWHTHTHPYTPNESPIVGRDKRIVHHNVEVRSQFWQREDSEETVLETQSELDKRAVQSERFREILAWIIIFPYQSLPRRSQMQHWNRWLGWPTNREADIKHSAQHKCRLAQSVHLQH